MTLYEYPYLPNKLYSGGAPGKYRVVYVPYSYFPYVYLMIYANTLSRFTKLKDDWMLSGVIAHGREPGNSGAFQLCEGTNELDVSIHTAKEAREMAEQAAVAEAIVKKEENAARNAEGIARNSKDLSQIAKQAAVAQAALQKIKVALKEAEQAAQLTNDKVASLKSSTAAGMVATKISTLQKEAQDNATKARMSVNEAGRLAESAANIADKLEALSKASSEKQEQEQEEIRLKEVEPLKSQAASLTEIAQAAKIEAEKAGDVAKANGAAGRAKTAATKAQELAESAAKIAHLPGSSVDEKIEKVWSLALEATKASIESLGVARQKQMLSYMKNVESAGTAAQGTQEVNSIRKEARKARNAANKAKKLSDDMKAELEDQKARRSQVESQLAAVKRKADSLEKNDDRDISWVEPWQRASAVQRTVEWQLKLLSDNIGALETSYATIRKASSEVEKGAQNVENAASDKRPKEDDAQVKSKANGNRVSAHSRETAELNANSLANTSSSSSPWRHLWRIGGSILASTVAIGGAAYLTALAMPEVTAAAVIGADGLAAPFASNDGMASLSGWVSNRVSSAAENSVLDALNREVEQATERGIEREAARRVAERAARRTAARIARKAAQKAARKAGEKLLTA